MQNVRQAIAPGFSFKQTLEINVQSQPKWRYVMTETTAIPFAKRLEEISMFFQGDDRVHQAMRRVADQLERAGIHYVIVGGMAVNAHHHQRTTKDVDFLLTPTGFAAFRQLADEGGLESVAGRPRRFIDSQSGVSFDILITGLFPGSGQPGPIAYPDPDEVSLPIDDLRVLNLPTLIQLKLAAGRYQDFADVVNLIRANRLAESFQEHLHVSVRKDYVECVEEMRREDEYESRQDHAFEQNVEGKSGPSDQTKSS